MLLFQDAEAASQMALCQREKWTIRTAISFLDKKFIITEVAPLHHYARIFLSFSVLIMERLFNQTDCCISHKYELDLRLFFRNCGIVYSFRATLKPCLGIEAMTTPFSRRSLRLHIKAWMEVLRYVRMVHPHLHS